MQSISEQNYENGYIEDVEMCHNGSGSYGIYTNHHSLPKNKEKNIKSELESLGFPYDIVETANEIYKEIYRKSGTKRGKRRKQLIFFCVDSAYNQLGIAESPGKIARICGLNVSDISKAHSMCSQSKTNYKAPLIHFEPFNFIPLYYKYISELISFSDGTLDDIMRLAKSIMSADRSGLEDEKPQTVAAAMIVFYINIHGLSINKKQYKEIFGFSDMTINKIKNRILLVYNEM